jgi:prepilin-type N-terminal cleavage/methylation domain-containing protein
VGAPGLQWEQGQGGTAVTPCQRDAGFSLIEIMLVVVLLSLIMLALMAVFNATQTAFRASVTQTDILQGGRATMDLLTADFRQMYPSGGSNATYTYIRAPGQLWEPSWVGPTLPVSSVNFWLSQPAPTIQQSLIATTTTPPQTRTNQVETFFILSYENQVWKGVGYFVDTVSTNYIYPLYRYDSTYFTLTNRWGPMNIFSNFLANLPTATTIPTPALDTNPNIHHILDGVLHLNVRAYDTNGVLLTNGYTYGQAMPVANHATFYPQTNTEVSMLMWSNTLPAAVEIQMGVLEDRSLSRAASFVTSGEAYNSSNVGFSNYVSQLAGKVHVFRQRVTIPNCDPTAYQ